MVVDRQPATVAGTDDRVTAPRLAVDLDSGVAPWRQIHDQIAALAASGGLAVGARLPSIRQLASDLGLAPGTVARAYRELESAGTLHTARRRGTVVAAVPVPATDRVTALTEQYVDALRAAGIPVEEAVDAVRQRYARYTSDHW